MPDLKQEYADSLFAVNYKYKNLLNDFFEKRSVFSEEMKRLLSDDFTLKINDLLAKHHDFCKEKFDRDLKNQ